MRGIRDALAVRSGAGGMKAAGTGGSGAASLTMGSGKSEGFVTKGRIVTSSADPPGSTAAATAAFAADSTA
jgi:hypothetical protein